MTRELSFVRDPRNSFVIEVFFCHLIDLFLIARLARSDPRNHFVVNFLFPIRSNFGVFCHLLVLDKFRHV